MSNKLGYNYYLKYTCIITLFNYYYYFFLFESLKWNITCRPCRCLYTQALATYCSSNVLPIGDYSLVRRFTSPKVL